MNLHKEWMTDNSLFGADYEKNLILLSAIERFDKQKDESLEGFSVVIDGTTEQVVIQEHTNPLNADKIDKKLHCSLNSNIKTGSIVEWENELYLVMSKPESNLAYLKSKIVLCNENIKWQSPSGLIYSFPCVATRSLLTKMDIKESSYNVSLLEGEMNIFVPNNTITETIRPNQRFYLGNYIYDVEGIDDISNIGIIRLAMKVTTGTGTEADNVDLKICDYIGEVKFEISNPNAELIVDETLLVITQFSLQNNIIDNPGYIITYSSSDPLVATISDTGLITTKTIGNVNITVIATASDNPILRDIFSVTVSTSVVDNYVVIINGDAEISYGKSRSYTASVTNNSIPIVQLVTWSILSGSAYATITSFTETTCVLNNIASGTVVLKAEFTSGENIISGTKTIMCRGMW